jgi:hypothetical protein
MNFVYNDGGRASAGYKGHAGDCVTRAIAIVTQLPYQQVYDSLNEIGKAEKIGKKKKSKSNARTGVFRYTYQKYLTQLGYVWVPTMKVGSGCKVHLRSDELPDARLVVVASQHLVAVLYGVIHDTHDCSRGGTRCVYGYFISDDERNKCSCSSG